MDSDKDPKLTGMAVAFESTGDDNEATTKPHVEIRTTTSTIIVSEWVETGVIVTGTGFSEDFPLEVSGEPARSEVRGGIASIFITTDGNDRWQLQPRFRATYADGWIDQFNQEPFSVQQPGPPAYAFSPNLFLNP